MGTPHVPATLSGTFQCLPSNLGCILSQEKAIGVVSSACKLMCTLGPSSNDVASISKLLEAGMKIARFDFTWGTLDYHQDTLDNLRLAMMKTQRNCAVTTEIIGREVTVINRQAGAIQLQAGQLVTLTCDRSAPCSNDVIPISALTSFQGVCAGESISIGQYLLAGSETSSADLTVQQVDGTTCTCVCNNSCALEGLQLTVALAGVSIPGPALSQQDEQAISTWGKRNEVDFVSVPFIRSAADVEECRAVLDRCGLTGTRVIAKIEDVDGLKAHQEIIDVADAVVFSRGKLGARLDPSKVFLAQKLLVRSCNIAGKPVFVNRVVDTMSDAPRPTRAEATDVANLVLDGADGISLGSETFGGRYPELTVQTVSAICRQAETYFDSHAFYRAHMDLYGRELFVNMSKGEALASSAVRAAEKVQARLMIVFTVSGNTARMIAKYKPAQPILAVVCHTSSSAEYSQAKLSPTKTTMVHSGSLASFKSNMQGNAVMRQCLSLRGVWPIMANPDLTDSTELLEYAIEVSKSLNLVTSGDRVIVSQCPRKNGSEVMEEMGVVSLVQVDDRSWRSYSKIPTL